MAGFNEAFELVSMIVSCGCDVERGVEGQGAHGLH
jgi:hypothetical protein